MPVIKNPEAKVRGVAMTQYPRQAGTMAYSIRTEKWRYHEVRKKESGEIVARELYDLSKGFIESENVTIPNPEVVEKHAALLDAHLNGLEK